MANTDAGSAKVSASSTKYVIIWIIALWTLAMFVIYYKFYDARPVSGPPQAARPSCALLKRHETRPRPPRRKLTPPWFPLLQDYPATVRTGKNLYVWPDLAAGFRLGNILFNYAATFGIAWRNGRIPLWPERPLHKNYDLARLFSLRVPLDRNKTIMRSNATRSQRLKAIGTGMYDRKFEHLPARNVTIDSVFASYKYFHHVEDQLRADFRFRPDELETARRWLEQQTPEGWKDVEFSRVLIHVRRTDYLSPNHARDGMPQPTPDYFRRSMAFFTSCLDRVQFVVLSDDPKWCRKNLNATTSIVFSSGHSPIEDMAIASLCNHAILTIGTYGWWAAWFANGFTITQQRLPVPGSALSKRLRRSDHYKPEWIGL